MHVEFEGCISDKDTRRVAERETEKASKHEAAFGWKQTIQDLPVDDDRALLDDIPSPNYYGARDGEYRHFRVDHCA